MYRTSNNVNSKWWSEVSGDGGATKHMNKNSRDDNLQVDIPIHVFICYQQSVTSWDVYMYL